MTILADKKAAAAAKPPAAKSETILARRRAQVPRGELTEMPFFGRVWVELVGEAVLDEIDGKTISLLKAEGLDPVPLNARSYDRCRDALTLSWAVRNPDDHTERAGTDEEWRTLDVDLLTACALVYGDVRDRLSPVQVGQLTQEQLDGIRRAIEKKNPTPLLVAGVAVLSSYLLSTDSPPATSPTTQSSTGESP